MKNLFTSMCLLFWIAGGYAQQVTIKGRILVHNSKYETGVIQYISEAAITAPFANPTLSDENGWFQLTFNGLEYGTEVKITVEKDSWEVVNSYELEQVIIGRKSDLAVSMAKEGYLEQAQAQIYNRNLKALTESRDQMIARLKVGGSECDQAVTELEIQLGREIANRFVADSLLNARVEELKNDLPEFALKLAQTNLDFASEKYIGAYETLKSGNLERVAEFLVEEKVNASEDIELLEKARSDKARLDSAIARMEQTLREKILVFKLNSEVHLVGFNYRGAAKAWENIVRILENTKDQEDLELADSYEALGLIYQDLGEYEKAFKYLEKNTQIKESLLPKDNPELAHSFNHLSSIYHDLGYYDKALFIVDKAMIIYDAALEVDHQGMANSYHNSAEVYLAMGQYREALLKQKKAIKIKEDLLDSDHSNLAISYNSLARIYRGLGQLSMALSAQEKAMEIFDKGLVAGHPDLAILFNIRAGIYKDLGQYDKALLAQEKAIRICQEVLEPDHPTLATLYHTQGVIYSALNELDSAITFVEKGLVIRKTTLPLSHPHLVSSLAELSHLIKKRGQRSFVKGNYIHALMDFQKALKLVSYEAEIHNLVVGKIYPPLLIK